MFKYDPEVSKMVQREFHAHRELQARRLAEADGRAQPELIQQRSLDEGVLAKRKLDRHGDETVVVSIRMPRWMFERLEQACVGNRTPRPMHSVGAYIRWLIESQLLRKRKH